MTERPERPKLLDILLTGFDDLTRHFAGEAELKATTLRLDVPAAPACGPADVAALRRKLGLTPELFASLLGVTPDTAAAWESGTGVADGPALRLIELFRRFPRAAKRFMVVSRMPAESPAEEPVG